MKIKKCVIIIAGMGTRFLPISKTISKEMLPIIDVPSIFLQVKEAYQSGIKDIIFVLSKRNYSLIKNYFTKDLYLDNFIKDEKDKQDLLQELNKMIESINFYFVLSKYPGTFGALYSAKRYLKDEYFALMYGDDLVDSKTPLLKQLIMEHEKNNHMVVAVKNYPYSKLPNYGVIKYGKDNLIDDLLYKKDYKNKDGDLLQGRFILHTKVLSSFHKAPIFSHQERQLPTMLLEFKDDLCALKYEGEYFDLGSKIGLLKANINYALKDNKYKDELLNYIKEKNSP